MGLSGGGGVVCAESWSSLRKGQSRLRALYRQLVNEQHFRKDATAGRVLLMSATSVFSCCEEGKLNFLTSVNRDQPGTVQKLPRDASSARQLLRNYALAPTLTLLPAAA